MLWNTQADHFRQLVGGRAQKLSVDAGFTCPNRDGTVGTGGCTFCLNDAFNPSYCRRAGSISRQIDEGIAFHCHRYRGAACYLAYFQAYSNTYAPADVLHERYAEALQHPEVRGLVVGTRPDCINDAVLEILTDLAREAYVAVELGIESCYDTTLQAVNRGHDFAATRRAVQMVADAGLPVGGHLIVGLPGESRQMIVDEVQLINSMPLTSIKLHQLQILHGTAMGERYRNDALFRESLLQLSLDEYVALVCDMLERLRPDMVVERLAGEVPPRYQACPDRSFRRADGRLMRNEEIPAQVEAELRRRGTRQGALYMTDKQTN